MTDYGVAMLIRAMARANKIMVPRWLYKALASSAGLTTLGASGIAYPGGSLPVEVSQYLPDDVMVIQERSGGARGCEAGAGPGGGAEGGRDAGGQQWKPSEHHLQPGVVA